MTTMKKNERRDLQTDVKLLLECLEYQKNDVHATKQAFVTLSTILNDSIEAKEEFQEAGGLEQVLSIVTTSKVHEVVEAGLYCLGSAVEKNVYSQKLLTNASVFSFLHGILSSSHRGASVRKKQTAAYLILCLVTNNGFGQNLARQSSCLQDILNVVRSVFLKTGRMNLMSFDTDVESMHDLWTSLLSAACACINNPMNEENQRICASLLPLMFNLLSCQKDCQIVRPILSFIGHTVASHSCNQDRVRKCGGLEILVHKLKSLQAWIENDSDAKETAVQLLFTLDACISDNDLSSRKFGELDGINIVIHILNNSTLEVSDRTQAILTLAHAIDAYAGNEQYIKKGDGIPVLIQQLTATNDEELNKIVKYLLHMCVSKDDNIESAGKQDQSFVSHMEAMKRFGDIQMLEKISELDNKLKSLQSKTSMDDSFDDDRAMSKFSKRDRMVYAGHLDETTSTHSSRRSSHCVKDASETPREKSLLQQLIKEKVEKERLEKLNQGLQETLIRNQTERFQHHKAMTTSDLDESIMSGFDSDTNISSHSRSRNNSTSRMHLDLANMSCRNRTNDNAATKMHPDSARQSGEPEYSNHMNVQPSQQFNNGFNNGHRNAMISSAHQDENMPLAYGMNSAYQGERHVSVSNKSDALRNKQGDQRTVVYQGRDLMINQANQRSKSNVDLISKENIPGSFRPNIHHTSTGTDNFDLNQSEVYYATPWSMSNPSSATEQRKNNDTSTNASHNGSVNSVTQSVTNKGDARPSLCDTNRQKTTSTTINRNAEIQCGTPFVLFTDQQEKIDSGNASYMCTSDSEAQTDFVNKPNFKTPLIVKKNTKTCDAQTKTSENLMKSTNIKPCSIQLEKCEQNVKPTEKTTQNLKTGPSNHQKNSSCSLMSQKSGAFFIKPIARAPKGKIRVTPLLGSSSDHGKCSSVRSMPSSVKSHKSQISDLVSEFDLNLLNNAQENQQNSSSNSKQMSSNVRQQPLNVKQQYTTPVNVVKSQNNVRRIDKVVEPRHGNAADRWQVHTSTPNRKSIQPVRPAFSDCGTRRFGFNSSSAVKSPRYNRRRSIDDSGIHSPLGELNVMPWGSPIDSDIDGFRSSSDVSEDEIKKPNINPTVLRSSKKKKNTTNGSCPGCVAPYVGEIELNSRTYNIVLETNPYTCDMHRKQRQIERNYINQQRKKMKLRSRPKGRILGVEPKSKRSKTCNLRSKSRNLRSNRNKENQFEFLTDTEAEISPVSADDDCNMNLSMTKSQKKRRQRVPYTLEEEANIIEGVEKLGKYWNQMLVTYKFHPSRTNVDLMWKYKRMRAASNPGNASTCKSVQSRAHRPFSMCEERRLRRGIMKFGYNWKTILKSFTFSEGRTTEDLRNRWRTIHGQT